MFSFFNKLTFVGGGVCKACVQAWQRTEDVDFHGGAQAEGHRSLWTKDRNIGNKRFHLTTTVKQCVKDKITRLLQGHAGALLYSTGGRVLSLRRPDACNWALANIDGAVNVNFFVICQSTLTFNNVQFFWKTIDVWKHFSIWFADHWIGVFLYQIQDDGVRVSFPSTSFVDLLTWHCGTPIWQSMQSFLWC